MEDIAPLLLNSMAAIGISRMKVIGNSKEETYHADKAIKQPLLIKK